MGGLLALALAARRGQGLRGLALLATPWDFHADQAAQARLVAASLVSLDPLMALQGELPVDVIQGLFASLDPLQVVRKFVAFSSLETDDPAALRFVAVEDWLNDGVPLAAPVARECLGGWYGENVTAKGGWQIDGEAIVPQRVSIPSLCILPDQDRIVPPASAAALAESLPCAKICQPAVGHVGMIVSAVAKRRVWRPLAAIFRTSNPCTGVAQMLKKDQLCCNAASRAIAQDRADPRCLRCSSFTNSGDEGHDRCGNRKRGAHARGRVRRGFVIRTGELSGLGGDQGGAEARGSRPRRGR
jgi:hypothetical protein